MRPGVWTPLPHAVPPGHVHGNGADDDHLQLAVDVVQATWFAFTAANSANGGPRAFARDFDEQLEVTRREAVDMRRRAGDYERTIEIGTKGLIGCVDSEQEASARVNALAGYAALGPIPAIAASGIPLIGTPEEIERRIRALADTGADLLLLRFTPMLDGLEAFGTAVDPRLHDLVGAP